MGEDTRYLTYSPWQGQLNNTRLCFETALVLAYISGRTLVIPSYYRDRYRPEWEGGEFRPLHPGEFLDLDHLATVVPMISQQQYEEGTTDGWRYGVYDVSVEPGAVVFCYPEVPEAGTADAQRLWEFAAGRGTFLQLTTELRECRTLNLKNPTLELSYAFFYFSNTLHDAECKRLIRDHVRFRPSILAVGADIAARLGNFAALHVRRGDFFDQRPEQDVTPQRILQSMDRAGVRSHRLYIASDELNREFFAPIMRQYETYFIDHFAGTLGDGHSNEDIACVEQVICSYAEVFLGTRLSTFSSYISRLRGYRGAADTAVRFTDGSTGSEGDEDGAPRFSWRNWLQHGNPLWGREYREGWTF